MVLASRAQIARPSLWLASKRSGQARFGLIRSERAACPCRAHYALLETDEKAPALQNRLVGMGAGAAWLWRRRPRDAKGPAVAAVACSVARAIGELAGGAEVARFSLGPARKGSRQARPRLVRSDRAARSRRAHETLVETAQEARAIQDRLVGMCARATRLRSRRTFNAKRASVAVVARCLAWAGAELSSGAEVARFSPGQARKGSRQARPRLVRSNRAARSHRAHETLLGAAQEPPVLQHRLIGVRSTSARLRCRGALHTNVTPVAQVARSLPRARLELSHGAEVTLRRSCILCV